MSLGRPKRFLLFLWMGIFLARFLVEQNELGVHAGLDAAHVAALFTLGPVLDVHVAGAPGLTLELAEHRLFSVGSAEKGLAAEACQCSIMKVVLLLAPGGGSAHQAVIVVIGLVRKMVHVIHFNLPKNIHGH